MPVEWKRPETISERFARFLREQFEAPVHANPLVVGDEEPAVADSGRPPIPPDDEREQPDGGLIETTGIGQESLLPHVSAGGASVLTAIVSAAALIGGLLLRSHYEPIKNICESGVGALGQTFSTSAQQDCSLASFWVEAGLWMAIFGGLFLVGAVATMIARGQQRQAGTGGW